MLWLVLKPLDYLILTFSTPFLFFQTSFFRQHHCDSTDTQLKYKSRAAQLYRDKLHNEAAKAMRIHGSKLFIDTPQNAAPEETEVKESQEDDFFEQASFSKSVPNQQKLPTSVKLAVRFFSNYTLHGRKCYWHL